MSTTINAMAGVRLVIDDYISERDGSSNYATSISIFDGVTSRTAFLNKAQLKILLLELEKRNG